MTSDSPSSDRPVFKTPNPNELQSEETREAVHDRLDNQPEADLTDVDRLSQEKNSSSVAEEESANLHDRQMGIIGRTAG